MINNSSFLWQAIDLRVPKDGFETHCSPISADVLFVLKKQLYCSLSFAISRCQALVSLSGLLSGFIFPSQHVGLVRVATPIRYFKWLAVDRSGRV